MNVTKVGFEYSVTLVLNSREYDILRHIASYSSSAAKMIEEKLTSKFSVKELTEFFDGIRLSQDPVERKLKDGLKRENFTVSSSEKPKNSEVMPVYVFSEEETKLLYEGVIHLQTSSKFIDNVSSNYPRIDKVIELSKKLQRIINR